MDVSRLRIHGGTALVTLIALTFAAGTARANNTLLNSSITAPTVPCNIGTGASAAQSVVVKAASSLTGTATITVTFTATAGISVTPSSQVLNATNSPSSNPTGVTFMVTAANPACSGLAFGSTTSGASLQSIQFKTLSSTAANGTLAANDASVNVNTNVTGSSGLVAPAVTVYCTKVGSNWIASSAGAAVSVTSTTTGGTPFTVDPTSIPSWLTVSSTAGGLATSSPVTFQVVPLGGATSSANPTPCGGVTSGSPTSSGTISLLNAPGSALSVTINIHYVANSPLSSSPTSISMTHIKNSGTQQTGSVAITSPGLAGAFFVVSNSTLPTWLTVNTSAAIAPATLNFTTTTVTDTLPPGTYNSYVQLSVSGYGDLQIPVTLFVTNSAPKLSITSVNPDVITWTIGTAYPTATIGIVSSDTPIAYTITTAGSLQPSVTGSTSGLVYSFGAQVPVTFNPTVFATVQPGTTLSGTVTFTWGSPATTTTFTINLTVASPGATLTGLLPATLPVAAAPQSFPVTLQGSGFVGGTNGALKTWVGIMLAGSTTMSQDSNVSFSPSAVLPGSILVTITVPSNNDPILSSIFASGGSFYIGVCNGYSSGTTPCSTPTGKYLMTVAAGPIVQGVTSASSFTEVTAPGLTPLAPYDMISIFGVNFCGTACGSSTILPGVINTVTDSFTTSVTPDSCATAANDRLVTVTFYPHGTTSGGLVAPILFATSSQINAIVPGALTAAAYDVVVSFASSASCVAPVIVNSNAFEVQGVTADPGIFTIGADGQGPAAALNASWNLVSQATPAAVRGGGSDSDIIHLYMTGLGAPTSSGNATATSSGCIAATGTNSYESVLQTAIGSSPTLANIDGAIMQPSLFLSGNLPPCLTAEPTVKIGNQSATVTYAGWVAGTVAGLYQIDAKLPPNTSTFTSLTGTSIAPIAPNPYAILSATQLPVSVTVGSAASQSGVTLWVVPQLKVAAPFGAGLSGTVGLPWSTLTDSNDDFHVIASEGAGPYRYAVTSGQLPPGLTLNAITGAISGTPEANSAGQYAVTVSATDSATLPVTGSVVFTLTVAADLYMTQTGSGTFTVNYIAAGTVPTGAVSPAVIATGGTAPYVYTATVSLPSTGSALPSGMSVNANTGVISITSSTFPAGTYIVTVAATDANNLTGSYTFTVVVGMAVSQSPSTPNTVASSPSTNLISTVQGVGGSGTYQYVLDPSNTANALLLDLNSATGALKVGTAADTSPTMPVIIDVTDTGTAPTGGTVAPQKQITLTVTISN